MGSSWCSTPRRLWRIVMPRGPGLDSVVQALGAKRFQLLEPSGQSAAEAIGALRDTPGVVSAEANTLTFTPASVPNTPCSEACGVCRTSASW